MLASCYSLCAKMNANKTQLEHFKSLLWISFSSFISFIPIFFCWFYFCTDNDNSAEQWEQREMIIKVMKMLVKNGFSFVWNLQLYSRSRSSGVLLKAFSIFRASATDCYSHIKMFLFTYAYVRNMCETTHILFFLLSL